MSPVTCAHYDKNDYGDVLSHLLKARNSPIFMSDGYHHDLIQDIAESPLLLFSRSTMWFMPIEYLANVGLRLDSRVYFYDATQSGTYKVYESYAIKGGRPIATMLFEWAPGMIFYTSHTTLFEKKMTLKRRSNLNGVVLRNSFTINQPPFIKHIKGSSGKIVETVGYYTDILSQLETRLNFTLKDTGSVDGWGTKLKNGTWIGLVGQLRGGKIDIAANFGISKERLNVIDYTWPTYSLKYTLITGKPTKSRLDLWAYIEIFPIAAWAVGLSCLVVSAVFFSYANKEPMLQGVALMLRLFLQLGYDLPLRQKTARVVLITSAFTYYLVFAYFNSDLTSKMTVKPSPVNIRSFQDVIDQDYKVAAYEKSFAMGYFKRAPEDSAMKWVYKEMLNDERAITKKFHTPLVMANNEPKTLAYHSCDQSDDPLWKNLVCLNIQEYTMFFKTIALQKNSEFLELVDHHLIKMLENGWIDRLQKKWMYKANGDYEGIKASVITVENLMFPFTSLAFGIFMALNILFVEWICRKCLKM